MPIDMKIYMRERRARNKEFAINFLGGKCFSCGSDSRLEFDHIEPRRKRKEGVIADMLAHGMEKLICELKKCQLLCKECHEEKTRKDFGWNKVGTHGTISTYTHCKCRCDECKKVAREYKRKRQSQII